MNEKNYYTLNNFYREKFGTKVFKISLDAGFSCPNKKSGGCTFCTTTPYIGDKRKSLSDQFEDIKQMLHKKWKSGKYIVYLEAGTNTYGSLEYLKSIYEPLITLPNVIGLNIGTRCDCLSDDILDYLEDLSKRTYLTIELVLQSSHDKTLKRINRGHTRDEFTTAVLKLKKRNINVVVHIINGLPGETTEMMLETISYLNSLHIDGIKIHMLYLENDSALYKEYLKEPFHILSLDEYIEIVARQLQILNKDVVIHRITGDPDKDKLVEPKWLIKKFVVLNSIDKYLKLNNIHQGDKSQSSLS